MVIDWFHKDLIHLRFASSYIHPLPILHPMSSLQSNNYSYTLYCSLQCSQHDQDHCHRINIWTHQLSNSRRMLNLHQELQRLVHIARQLAWLLDHSLQWIGNSVLIEYPYLYHISICHPLLYMDNLGLSSMATHLSTRRQMKVDLHCMIDCHSPYFHNRRLTALREIHTLLWPSNEQLLNMSQQRKHSMNHSCLTVLLGLLLLYLSSLDYLLLNQATQKEFEIDYPIDRVLSSV